MLKTAPVFNINSKEVKKLKLEKNRNIQVKKSKKKGSDDYVTVFNIALPKKWLRDMGVDEDNRKVHLKFKDSERKGKRIIITQYSGIEDDED